MQENTKKENTPSPAKIIFAGVGLVTLLMLGLGAEPRRSGLKTQGARDSQVQLMTNINENEVIPVGGVTLLVRLGSIGAELAASGVIDKEKFISLYSDNPALKEEAEKLLDGRGTDNLIITKENSPIVLNLLWAFGLGNKNPVLERGPMMDPKYGGPGNFASTGGWTIAKGGAMNHFSKHSIVLLTTGQQALVEKVAKNIYRPCCGNSTYFPDCNHGMAMLGLLELMASQDISEKDMYKVALIVNSYWFPDTYLTIAKYMKQKGIEWKDVSPEEMLSADYSSGSGFRKISSQVTSPSSSGVGIGCGVGGASVPTSKQAPVGCGVEGTQSIASPQRQQVGCGVQ